MMKDLAYTKAELEDTSSKCCEMPSSSMEKYPWGLSITLDEKSLKKLGVSSKDFSIGEKMTVTCSMHITSMSMNESVDGGKRESVSMVIAGMDLGGDETSEEDKAKKLYNE